MFKAAVGHGIDPDTLGAIEEALMQCEETLAGEIPQAGILIAAIDFEHEKILQRIRERYPNIILVGGTSIGEMSSVMAFQQDSLALMLFCSDEVNFSVGVGYEANEDVVAAAKAAITEATTTGHSPGSRLKDRLDLKLCYALGDGLGIDGVAMVKGLREATGHTVPILGGLTADDWQFKRTYQFVSTAAQSQVLQNSIVALTFSGNLKVSYGTASGQSPIGPRARVTKSESNTLYEIDHQPARNFYVHTVGQGHIPVAGGGSWGGAIAVYEPNETDFYL